MEIGESMSLGRRSGIAYEILDEQSWQGIDAHGLLRGDLYPPLVGPIMGREEGRLARGNMLCFEENSCRFRVYAFVYQTFRLPGLLV